MELGWVILAGVVIFFVVNGVLSSRQDKTDAEALRQTRTAQHERAVQSNEFGALQQLILRYGHFDGRAETQKLTREALLHLGVAASAQLDAYARNARNEFERSAFARDAGTIDAASRSEAFADQIWSGANGRGGAVAIVVAEMITWRLSPEVVNTLEKDRRWDGGSPGVLEATDPDLAQRIRPSRRDGVSWTVLGYVRFRFIETLLLRGTKFLY